MRFILIIAVMICGLYPLSVKAQIIGDVTKLPLPRFASMRSDKIYARTGPGTRYPIKWIYQQDNLPIEIVQEFDTWRKVRDIDGEEGWVHQSLLSGKRYVIQNSGQALPMQKSPDEDARAVALIESGAVLSVDSCENNWCEVSATGFEGWIPADSLWGVYENEQIE